MSSPPAAATVFVTDPRFPVKHLFKLFSPGTQRRLRQFSQALQAPTRKRKAKPLRLDSPGATFLPAPTLNQSMIPDQKSRATPFSKKVASGQFPVPRFGFQEKKWDWHSPPSPVGANLVFALLPVGRASPPATIPDGVPSSEGQDLRFHFSI